MAGDEVLEAGVIVALVLGVEGEEGLESRAAWEKRRDEEKKSEKDELRDYVNEL